MKHLHSFPLTILKKNSTDYSKVFHSKIFTLAASSESLVYTYAHNYTPHFNFCYVFFKNDEGYWVGDYKGALKIRSWIIIGARKGTGHVLRMYKNWQKEWALFMGTSRKLLRQDLGILSDRDLFN